MNFLNDKTKSDLYKYLVFFRVIDEHDSKLSLTNIAVIICLFKIIYAPTLSLTEVGAFMLAMLNYAYKKHVNSGVDADADTDLEKVENQITEIKSQVSAIALKAGLSK